MSNETHLEGAKLKFCIFTTRWPDIGFTKQNKSEPSEMEDHIETVSSPRRCLCASINLQA